MKAAIISLGSVSSKWTFEAMQKYFEEVDSIDLRNVEVNLGEKSRVVLYESKPFQQYDCIYLKGSFRYIQILTSISMVLENKVFMPISPQAFTVGHDKLLTHLMLQQHSIPMPETFISSNATVAKKLLEKRNYPIVMKFPSGTQGKGVMFAESYNSAASMLDAFSALNQPIIIQNYVETGGSDIRAIVVGNKVVAAMERKAIEGERRANIHAGGKGTPVKLDYKTKELAVKTANVLGANICAVDILQSKKGPLVIEVNLSPGLQGITEATKVNVADKIAKYLYDGAKKFQGETTHIDSNIMSAAGMGHSAKTIITKVQLNRNKIVIPDIITDISNLKKDDDILVSADKNCIIISKSKSINK